MSVKEIADGPELSEARREVLLRQLDSIFVAEGYRRSTMAELANRLRCSKRALYQIASSKEDLFLIIVAREFDEIWQLGLAAERDSELLPDRIHNYIAAAIVTCRRWSPMFLSDVESLPQAHDLLELHLTERMQRLEKMVMEGIRKRVFRRINAKLVAELIHVSASRFCSPSFLEQSKINLPSAIEQMCDLVWNGLLSPDGVDVKPKRKR